MDTFQGNYMENDLKEKREEIFPGNVTKWEHKNNTLRFFTDKDIELRVSIISDRIIRFRFITETPEPADFSYAISEYNKWELNPYEVKDKDDHVRITTDRLICTISKTNAITRILDKSGNVLCEDEKGFHWEYHKESCGDIVINSKRLLAGEHFYGLGDKPCSLDLRGKRLQNWGSDTYGYGRKTDPLYKNIPFYLSLHKKIAYGIFFDNSFRSFFDFGSERGDITSFWAHGGEMNYYFIYGPELETVTQDYTHLTGKPELPPMWALGYHQCKWSYYPESKVREICNEFRKNKIPMDAIYLDIDYMDGFRCFTWSKDYFPDHKKMVKDLANDGFKTVVIIDPGIKIDKNYSVYQEGIENDYFCKRTDGPLMKGSVWPGLCNFPDYTKPEVRTWWADLFKGLIAEDGIRGIWNDMNEPAVFEEGTFPDDVRHDYDGNPCSHRKAHNVYGMQMARATYDGVKKFAYPNRPFIITRSGYAGMQRYSSVWTGDNVASWEHLKIANTQCQRLSISGISFAGSDIGGFIEEPNGELYVRWLQMAVFHPFCRTHSSGDHGDQEPWSFGEEYMDLARQAIVLRYKILPYIYTSFWQYVTRGTPMLKPLSYIAQDDSETYYRMEEFGLGDHLFICPISESKVEGRWLYLPEGQWYLYWDDTLYNGRDEVWANAPMNQFPFFIKAGAVVSHYPEIQYVGEKVIEELILHVYYINGTEKSELYEDAGDGYGYEKGESNLKTFTVTGTEKTFEVAQSKEGKYTPSYSTYKVIFHGLPEAIKSIEVDGERKKLNNNAVIANVDFSLITLK